MRAFIGVDFDGTLSAYDVYRGPSHVGEPIVKMVDRVKTWLAKGKDVKIFTARVCSYHTKEDIDLARNAIENWCLEHVGQKLDVISEKHPKMYEFWDDKAFGVVKNTGEIKNF